MTAEKRRQRFIVKAELKHENKYDYSSVVYVSPREKVTVICADHGAFSQRASNHLQGQGCPSCAGKNKTTDIFINQAREVHGNRYDYSLSEYTGVDTKVSINCQTHGSFQQLPGDHIGGKGCPQCGGHTKMTTGQFITRAVSKHGDKYDYSLVDYHTSSDKIAILCKIHGKFEQVPSDHLRGIGCKKCGIKGKSRNTIDDFKEKAFRVHGVKYDYSVVHYTTIRDKVTILCHEHGPFEQTADSHLQGRGCPICASNLIFRSSYEIEISDFLTENGIFHHTCDRTLISPFELDIFIPQHHLAIEIDGLYYHSDKFKERTYHSDKTKRCRKAGVQLLHIYEDEWLASKHILKSKILHLCGLGARGQAARHLAIDAIDNHIAAAFCDEYHIQGRAFSSIKSFGAYQGPDLVGVMTFGFIRGPSKKIELTRFCSDSKSRAGMFSKMFKYAVHNCSYTEVISLADRRYSNGDMYLKAGFIHEGDTAISYHYVINGKKYSKQSFTKTRISEKFDIDVTKTEKETMEELGIPRIYDCGKMRFIWRADAQG